MNRSIPGGRILPGLNVGLALLAAMGGSFLAIGWVDSSAGWMFVLAICGLIGSLLVALLANVYIQRQELEFVSGTWKVVYMVLANLLIGIIVYGLMLEPVCQVLLLLAGCVSIWKLLALTR